MNLFCLIPSHTNPWDGLRPRVLDDVIVRLFSIIFERLWRPKEVLSYWRKAHVAPISKRRQTDSLGTTGWPVSIASITRKIIEQVLLGIVYVNEKKMVSVN